MLVITGTGRSGTSLWMQLLQAGGMPVLGERFPPGTEAFAALNPAGFYESALLNGIHAGSNPDPRSGAELEPQMPVAVKVLGAGLRITERRYLDRVLLSFRHPFAFAQSARRLGELHPPSASHGSVRDPLRWWFCQHMAVLLDASTRRYAPRRVAFEALLSQPEPVIAACFDWLELPLDPAAAAQVLRPSLVTARPQEQEGEEAEVCLRLHTLLHQPGPLGRRDLAPLTPAYEDMLARLRAQGL